MAIESIVQRTTRRLLAPKPPLRLSQWAEQYRVIPRGTSHYSGPWRNALAPHMVEPMDAVTDPSIEIVIYMGPAQAGKTDAMVSNTIGYFMHYDPSPVILVMPIDTLVESYSKERLKPMIRETPALAELVNVNAKRDSSMKIDEIIYPGGSLFIGSGAAATTYVQRARRVGIMDDLDQIAQEIKNQGDPVTLLMKRTETYPDRKLIFCSTPTDENSHIMRLYRQGDRRESRVPCPECGEYQSLVSERFIFEHEERRVIPDSVFYPCAHCDAKIPHTQADWMRARIRYERLRKTGRIASFTVKGGNYEAGWKPWPAILTELLEAKEKQDTYKTFWNVSLNRVWENQREVPDWERLATRSQLFERGDVPREALVLTLGVDVQHDRLEALLVGWGRNRQRYVIQHYLFAGDPANDSTWEPVSTLIRQTWPVPLLCTAVDSSDGVTSPHVYRFVREQQSDRVIAVKGSSRHMETYVDSARQIDLRLSGARASSGVKVWMVGTGFIKSELYSAFRMKPAEPLPAGWIHFAQGFSPEFYQQAVSETLATKRINGAMRTRWIKIRERNEILDLLVYTTAAAAARGWHTWTDAHWDQLDRARGMHTEKKPAQPGQSPGAVITRVSRPIRPF